MKKTFNWIREYVRFSAILFFLIAFICTFILLVKYRYNIDTSFFWFGTIILLILSVVFLAEILLYTRFLQYSHTLYLKIWRWVRMTSCQICGLLQNKLSFWLEGHKLNEGRHSLFPLTPTIDKERHEAYIRQLKHAVDHPDICNIALTGIFGSGKSSVLKTFRACYPKYKYVNISLASFNEVTQMQKSSEQYEKLLEYSILQQLFYQVRAGRIPSSRFGRIKWYSRSRKAIISSFVFLALIDIVYIFQPNFLIEKLDVPASWLEATWVPIVVSLFFCILIFVLTFISISKLNKYNITNITVDKTSIQLQEDRHMSVLNRYMDEILYLFQKMRYQIIIFEDLDRFDRTHIFTKLRELNSILNNSEELGYKVVFVYALKDDMFASAPDRTKFFDYIIPIIPYVNASNSIDVFKQKFREKRVTKDELSDEFLLDIASFISDTRVLMNVVNEYFTYRQILQDVPNQEKLLSMIVFKNIYPEEFGKLHNNEGVVGNIFNQVEEIKRKTKEQISKSVKDVNTQLEKINVEHLVNIRELQSVVIAAFLECTDYGHSYNTQIVNVKTNSQHVSISSLYAEECITMILNGTLGVMNPSTGHVRPVNTVKLYELLGNDFNYEARYNLINAKLQANLVTLQNERDALLTQLETVNQYSLQDLIRNNKLILKEELFTQAEHPNDELKNERKDEGHRYDLLKALLERGYLDEDYFTYMSIFHEGLLNRHDRALLVSIKKKNKMLPTESVTNPAAVISKLILSDYQSESIINYAILAHLLSIGEKEKSRKILQQIMAAPTKVDYIYGFVDNNKYVGKFLELYANIDPSLWTSILADINHNERDKQNMLTMLLAYVSVENLIKLNDTGTISNFINQCPDYPNLFNDLKKEKIESLIDKLNIKVSKLVDDRAGNNLFNILYEKNRYNITKENIRVILDAVNANSISSEWLSYTSIKESNLIQLENYIDANLNDFVSIVMLQKNRIMEKEEYLLSLLNNDTLSDELKKAVIKALIPTIIINVQKINNKELVKWAYNCRKVYPTYQNFKYYAQEFSNMEVDNLLITFSEENLRELCDAIRNEKSEQDEQSIQFIRTICMSESLPDSMTYAIFENAELRKCWPKDWVLLKETRLQSAIKLHCIPFSVSMVEQFKEKHPKALVLYLLSVLPDLLKNLSSVEISTYSLALICKETDSADYKEQLLSYIEAKKLPLNRTETANTILLCLSNAEYKHHTLMIEALRVSADQLLKMRTLTFVMNNNSLSGNTLLALLKASEADFPDLFIADSKFSLSASLEAFDFVKALQKYKVLGKLWTTRSFIRARVLHWYD